MGKRIAFFGASGGVGSSVAKHLERAGHELVCFGRTEVSVGKWHSVDVSSVEEIKQIASTYEDVAFDALIYAAGTWEAGAFSSRYAFTETDLEDNLRVLTVNLLAPIAITRLFARNLIQAKQAKLIFFGALSGLDHYGSREVANTATKFGMVGAIQALHAELKQYNISCSVINPGNIQTAEVLDDIASGRIRPQTAISLSDVNAAVEFLLETSNQCAITELNMEQLG